MSEEIQKKGSRQVRRTDTKGMDIKSYYARSIEEAVDRATCEMGPDAMLIDSRRAPAEARHIGEYEVRFATAPQPAEESRPRPAALQPPETGLALEVARMRSELGEMRRLISQKPSRKSERDAGNLAQRLTDAGFAPDLALEISEAVDGGTGARSKRRSSSDELLDAELRRRFAVVPKPGRDPSPVMVFGPPGAGKTTTLIKMAVQHSASGQGPVVLVNTDTFRIGAAEQMARYASILGVTLLTADTTAGLRQVLETRAPRALMLIDTPGLSGSDMELFEPLAFFLAGRDEIERQLVLPATMHWADMERVRERYERFRPTRLAFTHLDETDRFGSLITTACRSEIPVSWLSAGQRIPDDLEPATAESLARLVVSQPAADAPFVCREKSAS